MTLLPPSTARWNRNTRTAYKVIRVRLDHGVPTGEYEDFLTGFVVDNHSVWGRPVGVTVAHDGALLVTEDGNNTIWRISYTVTDTVLASGMVASVTSP